VHRGSTVLIHAIGGGVGLCLTQLATKAGCRVLGTVGTAGKDKRPLDVGAERVIDRSREDFVEAALEWTHGRGVDFVYDSVGAATLDRSFDAIRKFGHIVSYGEASGKPFANIWERMVPKSASFSRFHLGHVDPNSTTWTTAVADVVEAIQNGWLKIFIEEVFPLERAADMHRRLESRQVSGKLLLRVAGER
jgi:NADPH2:quinone reductase